MEIYEQAGADNIYIFGMRADTVANLYKEGNYTPVTVLKITRKFFMTQIIDGTLFQTIRPCWGLYHDLLFGSGGGLADSYFVLKDFGSYSAAHRRLGRVTGRDRGNAHLAVTNTACSGVFSSNRSIQEYNDRIWHLK